jgi:signal peptidase I
VKRWEPLAPEPGGDDDLEPFAPPTRPPSFARTIAELPALLVVAIALTFLVKALVAQAFFIPSGSMEPQLNVGDRVVVSRTAYRLHEPRRGDVIVFDSPKAAPAKHVGFPLNAINEVLETIAVKRPPDSELIKRVVGLPGERVEGRDGHVFIDGRLLGEPYLDADVTTSDFGPVKVPAHHLWVMGDNRSNSADSRVIGTVDIDAVVGRAIARVWPPGRTAFL